MCPRLKELNDNPYIDGKRSYMDNIGNKKQQMSL